MGKNAKRGYFSSRSKTLLAKVRINIAFGLRLREKLKRGTRQHMYWTGYIFANRWTENELTHNQR